MNPISSQSHLNNTSRKSLNKLNNDSTIEKSSNQDFNSGSSLGQRKQNNSWLAQSFRKAFGKIDNKKKLNSKNLTNSKMVSSLSVNNCSIGLNSPNNFDYSEKVSDRNSYGNSSKQSSISDDEEQPQNQNKRANKLSLLPNGGSHDTDSDYEEEKQNQMIKHKNSSLIAKRSFRSESELISKNHSNQTPNSSISPNSNSNCGNDGPNTQVPSLNERTFKGQANLARTGSKLSKTHKSVNSLLSTGNEQYQSQQSAKLLEINQPYLKNQSSIGRSQCSGLNSPNNIQKLNKWYFLLNKILFFVLNTR